MDITFSEYLGRIYPENAHKNRSTNVVRMNYDNVSNRARWWVEVGKSTAGGERFVMALLCLLKQKSWRDSTWEMPCVCVQWVAHQIIL